MVLNESIEIPPGLELINEVFTNELSQYRSSIRGLEKILRR